ncbi:DNA polymerase III subunit gamma and tau [Embleya sp. NPDC050493]|uniref:DNA polymerase III subunit gamma and tau n=1 Tax=Embleya sp. NPDC050493 TaxID=3363989 RepID=UPI00379D240D
MSLALYRRYRPETYAEVIGQEHVTEPLMQALRNNRVNHAYLFSGPRGCGKTTSARILARCLNCEQGPTPTPCGECQSCRDLGLGGPGSIDVIEIDAASHGGVDDARDLREKAHFSPVSSRYKIYIIDEAHMVTSAGFNALLKVVEEPPEHLKFIFATTEPEKVIGTIRSRTHHYPFRLVPPGVLRDHLASVCETEGIKVEPAVLPLVVRAGAGSVRDSMSVMDQLLAGATDDGVTYAMATSLLGFTDRSLLDDVVEAFVAQDGGAAFELVDRVIEGGYDPRRFVADLLERLRDLVILAAVPDAADKGLIDVPADQLERMVRHAAEFGRAGLTRAADIVNTGLTEMRGATAPRLQLELICARVLLPAVDSGEQGLQTRLERLERRVSVGGLPTGPAAPTAPDQARTDAGAAPGQARPQQAAPPQPPVPAPATRPQPPQPQQPQPQQPQPQQQPGATPGAWPQARTAGSGPPPAAPQQHPQQPHQPHQAPPVAPAQATGDLARVHEMWPQILDAVRGRNRVAWMMLQTVTVAGFDGTTLTLAFEQAGTREGFRSSGRDEIVRQSVQDAFGFDWRIDCVVTGEAGAAPARRPGGPAPTPSAAPAPAPVPTATPPVDRAPAAPPPGAWPGAPAPTAPAPTPPVAPPPPAQARPATAPSQPPPTRPQPRQAPPPPPEPDFDIPEDIGRYDDEDLADDGGLSTHELLTRELGATIIDESPTT